MNFDLVIFDCDGVLVDSERITAGVFCDMLGELGLTLTTDAMFETFVGQAMDRCLDIIQDKLGRPAPEDFVPELRRRAGQALLEGVTPVDGVISVLDQLTVPCCVASAGEYAKMQLTLGKTGLWPRFEGRIFSADDVEHSKPAPDVYLLAARAMGVDPARCAVIEDSAAGVMAGVAAGMTVFAYTADVPAHRLRAAGAHHLFERMADLPALLGLESVTVA